MWKENKIIFDYSSSRFYEFISEEESSMFSRPDPVKPGNADHGRDNQSQNSLITPVQAEIPPAGVSPGQAAPSEFPQQSVELKKLKEEKEKLARDLSFLRKQLQSSAAAVKPAPIAENKTLPGLLHDESDISVYTDVEERILNEQGKAGELYVV